MIFHRKYYLTVVLIDSITKIVSQNFYKILAKGKFIHESICCILYVLLHFVFFEPYKNK